MKRPTMYGRNAITFDLETARSSQLSLPFGLAVKYGLNDEESYIFEQYCVFLGLEFENAHKVYYGIFKHIPKNRIAIHLGAEKSMSDQMLMSSCASVA